MNPCPKPALRRAQFDPRLINAARARGPDRPYMGLALGLGSGAFIFSTPPADPTAVTGLGTTATFTESSLSFMTPPNPAALSTLRNRGAKLIVFHGSADPAFSCNDTLCQ